MTSIIESPEVSGKVTTVSSMMKVTILAKMILSSLVVFEMCMLEL